MPVCRVTITSRNGMLVVEIALRNVIFGWQSLAYAIKAPR